MNCCINNNNGNKINNIKEQKELLKEQQHMITRLTTSKNSKNCCINNNNGNKINNTKTVELCLWQFNDLPMFEMGFLTIARRVAYVNKMPIVSCS